MRRRINTEGFKPVIPDVDFNDPISILRAGFGLHRQANSDIEGNVVAAVSDILVKHPARAKLFPHLSDQQIKYTCFELDKIFENQEFCAQCESWSHYEKGPEEFAIDATDEMLWILGGHFGLAWFRRINSWKDRQAIIKAVLREKLSERIGRLLLPDKDGKV